MDLDDLDRMEGMFVGQLNEHELRVFNNAVAKGWAERSYEGGGGLMGLAKVRLVRVPAHRIVSRSPDHA